MNLIDTIDRLADILNEKSLSVISIKCDDLEIRIATKQPQTVNYSEAVPTVQDATPAVYTKSGNYVLSPLVGTFYAAPAPDKPPFVKVGDKVAKGQVVCIVESMKVMNEITCEFDGTVAEILANDGEAVDFNKELIRIE